MSLLTTRIRLIRETNKMYMDFQAKIREMR